MHYELSNRSAATLLLRACRYFLLVEKHSDREIAVALMGGLAIIVWLVGRPMLYVLAAR